MERWTYETLDGEVLDLTGLTDEERAHLDRCAGGLAAGLRWADFGNRLVFGRENPLIRDGNGLVTRAAFRHPLFRAIRDMGDRLGIAQNEIGQAPGDEEAQSDPFADGWMTTTEAARRKGVALNSLQAAIDRGDVITRLAKPGGSWRLVSANSVRRWQPSEARRRARKAAAEAIPAGSH